jgi:predicted DNA-binding WGR domain protein
MWRWETATRYYMAWMQRNLWGEWEIVRAWGGKDSARGRVRFDIVADTTQGQRLLLRLERERQRRGYRRVLPPDLSSG